VFGDEWVAINEALSIACVLDGEDAVNEDGAETVIVAGVTE
jgi:hypothetical protein